MARSRPFEPFFSRFRADTEKQWTSARSHALDFVGLDAPLPRWLKGASWQEGLGEDQVAVLEEEWGLRFPDDYRIFLKLVHAQKRRPSFYKEEKGVRVLDKLYIFFDWIKDADLIRATAQRVTDRLLDEVRTRGFWLDSWGRRPAKESARKDRAEAALREAPGLIPITPRDFMVSGERPSPIFSLHPYHFDFWVDQPSFPAYLLRLFGPQVGSRISKAWEKLLPGSRKAAPVPNLWTELAGRCREG